MDLTTEIYFDEIVENFIKLVQAVHEVGDKVQMEKLAEKRAKLYQVISLIEPKKIKPDTKKARLDSDETEEYDPFEVKYDENNSEGNL